MRTSSVNNTKVKLFNIHHTRSLYEEHSSRSWLEDKLNSRLEREDNKKVKKFVYLGVSAGSMTLMGNQSDRTATTQNARITELGELEYSGENSNGRSERRNYN